MDTRVLDEKRKYTEEIINKINEAGYILEHLSNDKRHYSQVFAVSKETDNRFKVFLRDGETYISADMWDMYNAGMIERINKEYETAIQICEIIKDINLDKVIEVRRNEIVK